MAKTMLICKACGKEYEACRTPNPGIFRWRDVACSEECARKYIHDVMVARGEITEEPAASPVETEVAAGDHDQSEATEETADVLVRADDFFEPDVATEPKSWRPSRSKKK